ncbi:hypothetical protein FRC19_011847 [Serendipita sp. 401]|nr:hypothetical protein FRC19_011847 [Serendipita sp. 401]
MHVCTGLSACPKRRIERRTELTDSTDNVSARLEMPGMSPASLTTSTNSDKQPSPPVNIAPLTTAFTMTVRVTSHTEPVMRNTPSLLENIATLASVPH